MGKRHLLWFSVSFVVTVILGALCENALSFLCVLAFLVAVSAFYLCHTENKTAAVFVIIAVALSVIWQTVYFEHDKLPDELFLNTSDISAEVVSYSETEENESTSVRARIYCEDKRINVLIYMNQESLDLAPGDKILMDAKIYEFENTEDFAAKTYYKSRYIDVSAFASYVEVVEKSSNMNLRYLPEHLAKQFKDKIDELYDENAGGFIKSLILGDKSDISSEFNDALKATGLSHAVSVSGMHISFIIGLLLYFSKKKYLKLASIPVIVLFAFMVGAPQSALRAVIMQTLIIIASFSKREYDPLTAISVAAFILVAINPYCATDIAFLLSFFATLGIIVLHPKIMSFLKCFSFKKISKLRKLSIDLMSTVSVSVSASIFTMPISSYSFDFVSVIAPLSNMILNSFITLAFSAGCLNTLLGFVCPNIAALFAKIINYFIGGLMNIISTLALLPFAEVFTQKPMIIVFICFVCFVLAYAISVGGRKLRVWFTVCVLVISSIALGMTFTITNRSFNEYEGIRFDVLDVGQGQCIVATSGETCTVIDCGGDKSADDVAILHLLNRGIKDIDAMILTHAHADHANGVEYLMDKISAKAVYLPASDKENATFINIAESADEECEIIFVESDELLELEGMQIKLLTLPPGSDENENGLVVIVSDGDYETLITGDIPIQSEKLILEKVPDCESYIVGHHGSKTSSSQALLNKALPELSVISVGFGNTYGHPASQTLTRLENIGTNIKRTDLEGTITFYSREQKGEAA